MLARAILIYSLGFLALPAGIIAASLTETKKDALDYN
jgi:hypothetical protein